MCASDFPRRAVVRLLALSVLMLSTGCQDPTLTRIAPELNSLTLFLILDPDEDVQPLLVKQADTGDGIEGLAGELSRGGAVVAAVARGDTSLDDSGPCHDRYSWIVFHHRCIAFSHRPEHGATYRVRVSADGQPSAIATATVPAAFTITELEARGELPGTEGLAVTWTRSVGTYRYVVAVRPTRLSPCMQISDCDQSWFAATSDTTLQATVPAEALEGSGGPWTVDVYAMDKALYQYLTTGTSGNLFPVAPVQNVEHGLGAVGAWVRRSRGL